MAPDGVVLQLADRREIYSYRALPLPHTDISLEPVAFTKDFYTEQTMQEQPY